MSFNRVILVGRLTKDPEMRQTTNGISVTRFTVACDRPYKSGDEKKTDFIDCQAWRQTAEFIAKYFSKGSAILIEGELQNNNYTDKNGVKHYGMLVLANKVTFVESKKSSGNGQDGQSGIPDGIGAYEEVIGDGDIPF